MIEQLKRYGLTAVIFTSGLMAGVIMQAVMAESAGGGALEPGTPIIDLQADAVMTLSYTTAALTMSAQRSQQAAQFAVQLTYADGRPARHCAASPTLDGHLGELVALTAVRPVPIEVVRSDFPARLGVLELRGANADTGKGAMTLHARRDGGAIAMVMAGGAGELNANGDLFERLGRLCAR